MADFAVLRPLWHKRQSKSICSLGDTGDGQRLDGDWCRQRAEPSEGRNLAELPAFSCPPRGTGEERQP